jgi:hypothetical protein
MFQLFSLTMNVVRTTDKTAASPVAPFGIIVAEIAQRPATKVNDESLKYSRHMFVITIE